MLLLIWYYSSAHFFVHVHEVNGVKITHSHPCNRQHDHASLEYQFYKILGESFVCNHSFPFFSIVVATMVILLCCGIVCRLQQPRPLHYPLRAPPVVC